MMFVTGCTQQIKTEYVQPLYAPLNDSISKPTPEPIVTEHNLVKWKDALKLMNDYKEWGEKERNRANACVIIYQKLTSKEKQQ